MSIKKFFIIGIGIGLFISFIKPFIVYGQVKISEIMYDPAGSDTKREWIEVINTGTSVVDLNTYFFFENSVFHKLVAQDVSILLPGEYAIIVDSIPEVLAEYASFAGKIFDSAFSLNNTGETISIANSAKENIDTVTYSNTMGANNDGNSLQITDGVTITAGPTFGGVNKTVPEVPASIDAGTSGTSTSSGSSSGSSVSSHTQQGSLSTYTPPASFKIGAGRDRMVSIHTPIEFVAQVSKSDVSPKFLWNFGDFHTDKGKKVEHTYKYEGLYQIVLEGKTKDYQSISRTEIKVFEPDLELIYASSTLNIHNKSKHEINIGEFEITFQEGESYIIPKNTIIAGNTSIKKDLEQNQVVQGFVYPNGEIYQRFDTI